MGPEAPLSRDAIGSGALPRHFQEQLDVDSIGTHPCQIEPDPLLVIHKWEITYFSSSPL
jgi:hypothetical protein